MTKISLTQIDGTKQDQLTSWLNATGAGLLIATVEAELDAELHRFSVLTLDGDDLAAKDRLKRVRDLTTFLEYFTGFQAKTNHHKIKLETYDAKMDAPPEPES